MDSTQPQPTNQYKLVILKDNKNVLPWIVISLMEILQYPQLQAEQCAYICHYTGSCVIKTNSKEILEPLLSSLLERCLTVELIEVVN